MTNRKCFDDYRDGDVDIMRSADGQLFIEVSAEYGDSENGWGTTSKTIHMNADMVRRFIEFLK